MEFLKSSELELNPAGYLIGKKSGKPVSHEAFVSQQKSAEYIVKLSEAIKGKTFTTNKVDSLDAIKAEVRAAIAGTAKKYVSDPEKPVSKVNEEMIKFALDFNDYEDAKVVNKKINEFMEQFSAIDDVETVGDYFSEGTVKLNNIYTIEQILNAVKANVAKLGSL